MPNIDARLTSAYEKFVSSTDVTPGKVDENEAIQLLSIAEDLNEGSVKCCGLFGGDKGDKHINRLVEAHKDKFDSNAQAVISKWVKDHKMPTSSSSSTSSTSTTGTTGTDSSSIHGKKIGEWKSEKATWHCHWFPMRATRPGGDPINNLYAEGGALAKYDAAFGGKSRSHELATAYKAHDSDAAKYGWWGHCNNASEVACLLKQPVREVTMNGQTFSPHDIQGLLVKVSQSLSERVDFKGDRYNGPSDDPNEPTPADFMKNVLKAWGSSDAKPMPFVLDIDRTEQVWNYPFDQGKIFESDKAPQGFDSSSLPSGGKIKFYRAEVKGTGFDEQARTYQFWIQYDNSGAEMKSAWIAGEDGKISPDFAWRPHPKGDLSKATSWVTDASRQSNPYVLAENVFKLYQASIA